MDGEYWIAQSCIICWYHNWVIECNGLFSLEGDVSNFPFNNQMTSVMIITQLWRHIYALNELIPVITDSTPLMKNIAHCLDEDIIHLFWADSELRNGLVVFVLRSRAPEASSASAGSEVRYRMLFAWTQGARFAGYELFHPAQTFQWQNLDTNLEIPPFPQLKINHKNQNFFWFQTKH